MRGAGRGQAGLGSQVKEAILSPFTFILLSS